MRLPGWLAAAYLAWLTWALMAPFVVGPIPMQQAMHICPTLRVVHRVSCPPPTTLTGNKVTCLSTTRVDRCATDWR